MPHMVPASPKKGPDSGELADLAVEARDPDEGDTVDADTAACASLGRSNVNDCGTVTTLWMSWFSGTSGFTVWGGDTSGITAPGMSGTQAGDSGSPLYHLGVGGVARALGVLDTSGGLFARLDTSLDDWGATVVN